MSLSGIRFFFESQIDTWRSLRLSDLQYWHRSEARLALLGLVALAIVMLVARTAMTRRPGRHRVLVPAILALTRRSPLSFVRHAPLVLFLIGLPFFVIALSDPFTALVSSDVTYPGRRIAVLIDASTSMRTPFRAATLNKRAETDAAFFTTVAAAERFIQMRKSGRYRDLLALVEFGNQAYVITPFTHDYDNILVSISLIGDPVEFSLFPDQGTIIGAAIDEGISLFKAFNFLEASGNIMVIFSDGEDTRASIGGKTLDEIVQAALDAKIPVYLVRTNYDRGKGKLIPDELWIPVIERTGGKFYAADNEKNLLDAIAEIDKVSAGTIQTRQYSSQEPRFEFFAFAALACWTGAAAMKLLVPQCQKLP
jgi:Ca-activated chloride channel family protein